MLRRLHNGLYCGRLEFSVLHGDLLCLNHSDQLPRLLYTQLRRIRLGPCRRGNLKLWQARAETEV